jgi:hypothetical protein
VLNSTTQQEKASLGIDDPEGPHERDYPVLIARIDLKRHYLGCLHTTMPRLDDPAAEIRRDEGFQDPAIDPDGTHALNDQCRPIADAAVLR